MSEEAPKPLDRYLSPLDVWSMAFGCMVGWGVFAMPGNTFLPVAGPAGTVIAVFIGMLVMLIIGRNFSYMMQRSPMTGGVYSYTKEAFGRDHAFLCSWFLCLSYLTIVFLNGTALFYVVRILFADSLQGAAYYTVAGSNIYVPEIAVSVLVLAATGLLFVAAKPLLQKLHTLLAVILFSGIAVTAAFCLPGAFSSGAFASFGSGGTSGAYGVFSIVILSPWAFVGFEVTSFDTAHFRFEHNRSRRILTVSIIAAALAYAAMTLVSVSTIPDTFSSWQEYIGSLGTLRGVSSVPTFYAAGSVMGRTGLVIMAVTAVSAILTGIIGGYRATTRILSTMAEDRILSEKFSRTTYSILFIMLISVMLTFLGRNTLNWFVDLTSFGAVVGFGYTSAAAFKAARTEGNRPVEITGLAGTAVSAVFLTVQMIPSLTAMEAMGSEAFLLLALWCLLGFLFYWRTVNKSTLTEYSGMSASGTVLFALLIYSSVMWLAKRLAAMEDLGELKGAMAGGGALLMGLIFAGLVIMLYVQNLVRTKHEQAEREKIRAVEGSLAKSRFLFNMSHDIRTPMNAIIGYTNLALKEPSSDTVKDYLSKIELSGRNLLSLINDILEMSRIESGTLSLEPVPTDICAVFDEVRYIFTEQMKQKSLEFTVHTSLVQHRWVWCDGPSLTRVVMNLVSNSGKFTPEGGTVTVSLAETASEDEAYASYEISVTDSGIGMSREFVEKMFNAFERERTSTDSGTEGTGLGLAITKNIVDMMGGTIEVITSPGNGTRIILRIRFALCSDEDIPAETGSSEGETADFSSKRLLVVEDNAVNMEIACMILSSMGFTLEKADNGKAALDAVSSSPPGYFDAILMDIQMPVMDGYDAARAIRSLEDPQRSSVPILAMTANAFSEDVADALDAGMQGHIAKPIDIGLLTQELARVLK